MIAEVAPLELAWTDRSEPFYELASSVSQRRVYSIDEALDRIEQGQDRFFGPLPRVREGCTKECVAEQGNLLWVDIDVDGGEPARKAALDEALKRARELGVFPSLVVDSGRRGWHLYWKLSDDIPVADIEGYNKLLSRALGGDMSTWTRERIMRIPGFRNPKSGRLCQVVEETGYVHEPDALEVLGTPARTLPRLSLARDAPTTTRSSLWVPPHLNLYLASGQVPSQYASRSEAEEALIYWYCKAGWSDEEIIAKALGDGWDKATEIAQREPNSAERYLRRSLTRCRDWMFWEHDDHIWTSPEGGVVNQCRREYELCELLSKVPATGQSEQDFRAALAAVSTSPRPQQDAERKLERMVKAGLIRTERGKVQAG